MGVVCVCMWRGKARGGARGAAPAGLRLPLTPLSDKDEAPQARSTSECPLHASSFSRPHRTRARGATNSTRHVRCARVYTYMRY